MQKTIVALYDDVHEAHQAVRDLVDSGINRDQVSLLANNASGELQNQNTDVQETSGAAEGAGVGAGIGAALGGIGGLLVGLGALVIPGIGPVLAAGPLAAAVGGIAGAGAGAIAGGAAGGLIGALTDMGVNEEQAGYYAEGVRRGGTLLTVRADDSLAPRAVEVMNRHHPVDVRQRASQWRDSGWTGFDPNAAGPYEQNQDVRGAGTDFRTPSGSSYTNTGASTGFGSTGSGYSSETGMGNRGNTGLANEDVPGSRAAGVGGDIGSDEGTGFQAGTSSSMNRPGGSISSSTDYDAGRNAAQSTGMGDNQGAGYSSGMGTNANNPSSGYMSSHTFDTYEPEFRNDYNSHYANRGYTYNQYQMAYRYGYDLAGEDQYRGRDWVDVEAQARQDWETQHPDSPWDNFKDAVHHAWMQVRNVAS